MNEYDNKRTTSEILKSCLLLMVFFLTIGCDIGISSMKDPSELYNERVEFGQFTIDRTADFYVEEETDINIETYITKVGGNASISIMSPLGMEMFRNDGEKDELISFDIHADVGLWKCHIVCDNAQNGEYSVCVKRK